MAVVQVFKGLAGAVVEVDMKELKRSPDLVAYIRQRFFGAPEEAEWVKVMKRSLGEVELLEPSKSWQEHGSPPELQVLLEHRDMSPEAHAQVMAIVCPEGQWVRENSPLGQQQLREVLQKTHPDVRDEHGVPLLHQMVKHASPYVAELARAGADLNLKQATGERAMEVALVRLVEYGFSTNLSSILQLLTREGAGLKDLAAAGLKDLALWAVQCDALGVLAALRRNPQWKMSRCAWMEVIQSACEQRSTRALKYMLNVDITIEPKDFEGLFTICIANGDTSALEAMFALGGDLVPDITKEHLEQAIAKNDREFVRYLLSKVNPLRKRKWQQILDGQWT